MKKKNGKLWILVILVLLLCAEVVYLTMFAGGRGETETPNTEIGEPPAVSIGNEYVEPGTEVQETVLKQDDPEEESQVLDETSAPTETVKESWPWDESGKYPDQYTWEEYLQLTPEERNAFIKWFKSEKDFEAWMESVKPVEITEPDLEWNKPGKLPNEYTWEEYQQLTLEEREAFLNWFAAVEDFEDWMEKAKPEETTEPDLKWNKPGKQPNEYTWEEYQQLTLEEQDAFFRWFKSEKDFESWMEKAKPEETTEPDLKWNKPGKQPNEYTWEEYQALTPEEQDAFFKWFKSEKDFEAWMEKAKPEETDPIPEWNKPGKLPNEYTWEEYQALSPKEQDAFFKWFKSAEDFEAWMEKAKPEETDPIPEWNKPGKLPNEYTWEEYQALTPEEQDAFFKWFKSEKDFEAWMEKAKPEDTDPIPEWNKPGKLPNEYTWEEYQALTPEEQDAFFKWFKSIEDFEAWMEKVKPEETTEPDLKWNKPGKLPDEYTWAEYEALTPEEKDAFFLWFDSVDDFEAWMEAAQQS